MAACADTITHDFGTGPVQVVIVIGAPPCLPAQGIFYTQSELDNLYGNNPMNLTLSDGGMVAGAVLAVWACGWL